LLDVIKETVITFQEATEIMPRRRRGRKPHISTLYRWSTSGCRGVVLDTVQVGATRCTSREALQRFFENLTISSRIVDDRRVDTGVTTMAPLLSRTPSQRQQASEQAARQLERLGV
jgi:hypothetical protein